MYRPTELWMVLSYYSELQNELLMSTSKKAMEHNVLKQTYKHEISLM